MSMLFYVFISLIFHHLAFAATPQALQWSEKTYGPDGPWRAVKIMYGTPGQQIDLIPGGFFNSILYSAALCPTVCDAQIAGLYDPSASSTQVTFPEVPKAINASASGGVEGVNGSMIFDNLNIFRPEGSLIATIPSFDMAVWTSGSIRLPGGKKYPLQIGNLALGARDVNQTFQRGAGLPNANGTLLPSYLFSQGVVPSNSYGLHIGSVALSIPSSLYIGGYDQSRALGTISAQPYALNFLPIDLLDISIGVAVGNSPFNFTSKVGLLAQGNSSIDIAVQTRIDSVSPYLYLPQSTCDAITAELPVNFQPEFGVYFWDTTDARYEKIVSSPSYLGFTFRLNGGTSSNMTINVPFSLLNLTLTTPITTTPTQYFPCFPINDSSPYMLGKAFLQASFVGVTWQENHEGVWFLAQAPGPNTPSLPSVTAIDPEQKTIIASENVWIDTWKNTWTPIGSEIVNLPPSSNNTTKVTPPSTAKGISGGVIAGIVVGAIFGLALLVLGFLFIKRKLQSRKTSSLSSVNSTSGIVQEWQYPSDPRDNKQGRAVYEMPRKDIMELQASMHFAQKGSSRFSFDRRSVVELQG